MHFERVSGVSTYRARATDFLAALALLAAGLLPAVLLLPFAPALVAGLAAAALSPVLAGMEVPVLLRSMMTGVVATAMGLI